MHAQVRASKSPAGTVIRLADAFDVTVGERRRISILPALYPADVFELIAMLTAACRCRPISNTMHDAFDETRYQTVHASKVPAVADSAHRGFAALTRLRISLERLAAEVGIGFGVCHAACRRR